MNLYATMKIIHQNAVNKGFYETPPTFGEHIALLHSEASEALEAYRDEGMPSQKWDSGTHPITEELADVFIRLLDMSAYHGLDLPRAIELKMAKNVNRPYKHGGKRL